MIGALLLAAGRGTRFGGAKLLAPLGGRPVIRWSAEAIADVGTTLVVVPPGAAALAGALDGLHVRVQEHPGHEDGIGSSIAAGVAALPSFVDAVCIALGDQPLVSPAVVARLCARWRAGGARAVAPRYRDGRGHPVVFDRACFPALRALTGDAGARAVLDSLGDALALVDVDDAMPLDVDTPEALAAVARQLDSRRADG